MDDLFAHGLPTLNASRLRLRQLDASDVSSLLVLFGDAEALQYWSHGPLADLGAARGYLDGITSGWRDRAFFQWGIEEAESHRLVGTVTLGSWDRGNRRAEIGFILHPAYHGRGLATEAVRTALDFGFGPMNLHRVEADVDPANERSLRLLERLGFQREGLLRQRWFTFGTWKDTVLLGLLAEDIARA